MDVAIMFSGGKDSTLAVEYALAKGYTIKYLLSVKPSRRDCYLYHYATVEWTKDVANALNLPHILVGCDVADPIQEAEIVKAIVEKNPVDAVILGGVGLQETQIKSVRDALFPLGTEVFAAHAGQDHGDLTEEMIKRGYRIIVTEIAADGFTKEWLGREMTLENYPELKALSEKFGFHIGFEGGHANTLVIDGPIFTKRLEILKSEVVMENGKSNDGYLLVKEARLIEKVPEIKKFSL